MKKELEQVAIIGLGKFGMSVAKLLTKYDCDVLAIDDSEALVEEVIPYVTRAIKINAVDVEALIARLERKGKLYNDSMFWFDVSSVVFGILLVATLFNVINFIWKLVLMNSEKKLVKAGKEGKAV